MSQDVISQTNRHVVWAIDPQVRDEKHFYQAKKALQTWDRFQHLQVKPVALVTPLEINWPLEYMTPWQNRLQDISEKNVKPILKSLHLSFLEEPEVVIDPSLTIKGSVDKFLDIARREKAEMILVTTHRRKGMAKFRIGSFTQKLMERCRIPLLIVRPDSNVPKKFSRILYPTDFSKNSKKSYRQVIDMAKKAKAQVVLYHNFYEAVWPIRVAEAKGSAKEKTLRSQVSKLRKQIHNKAKLWVDDAQAQGVHVEFVLGRGHYTLSRAILLLARLKKADLLALGIDYHPIARGVLGSAAREIVETSKNPVLVINSDIKK